MKKHASTDMLTTPIAAGAAGLGIGLGARGVKHLLQLALRSRAAAQPKPRPTPVTELPVEVTPEEAATLESRGVQVKIAEGFLPQVLGGAALAGGTYAGWGMLSKYLEARKRQAAQQRLERSRSRVESLLDGGAQPGDQVVAGAMKTAEDAYLRKQAGVLNDLIGKPLLNGMGTVVAQTGIGWPLGITGFLLGARAFRRTADENKNTAEIGKLRRVDSGQREDHSTVAMVPVLKKRRAAALGQQLKDANVLSVK